MVYKRLCELEQVRFFFSTDEDPGLRIESLAIIKLRGVTTKLKYNIFHHANCQGTIALYYMKYDEHMDTIVLPVWSVYVL